MKNPVVSNLIVVVNDIAKSSKDDLIATYRFEPGAEKPAKSSDKGYPIALGKAMNLLREAIEEDSDRIQDYGKYAWIVLNAFKYDLNYKKAAEDFKIGK